MTKKICFLNSVKDWGGGEKWHHDMACRLHALSYPVIVMANSRGELFNRLRNTGVALCRVQISNFSFLNPLKVFRLARKLKKEEIDTLIVNLPDELKAAGLAARLAGVRRVIYRRGSAIPIRNTSLNRWIFRYLVDDIIANSHETARTIRSNNPDLFPPEHIHVIYNGLDMQALDPAARHIQNPKHTASKESDKEETPDGNNHRGKKMAGEQTAGVHSFSGTNHTVNSEQEASVSPSRTVARDEDVVVIGTAGRFVKQKGQSMLLDVAAILKERGVPCQLRIAGDGNLDATLKEKALELGLEQMVEFTGFVKDIKAFMDSIDVFALPSLWEGFGYVMVEAMACSKPVVAFRLSSNPEIVEDQKTGYLIEPFDLDAFADTLQKLIATPEEIKRMGQAACQRARDHFSLDQATNQLVALLNDKMADGSPGH